MKDKIDVWTKVAYNKEACDLGPDPVSGALVARMSGSMIATMNNYYSAGCSINGRRIFAIRFMDPLISPDRALLAIDLDTKWTALLDSELADIHVLPVPFAGVSYYVNRKGELCRFSLETFEKETIMTMKGFPAVSETLRAITPDQKFLFYITVVSIREGLSLAVVRVDLEEKIWKMIYENSGLHHTIYMPGENALLVGRRVLKDGSTPPLGAWKNSTEIKPDAQLMDFDGKLLRKLGVPPGYTYCDERTGYFVCNCPYDQTKWAQLSERPQGNMVVFKSLDWQDGRVIDAPDHLFFHIAGSSCGKYVVSEAMRIGKGPFGPVDIVVVNWLTGKHRVLVSDCGSKGAGGGSALRQPTPYMTSDNSYVVYNADPDGILNVYSAKLPDGFLQSLD